MLISNATFVQLPKVASGSIRRFENFESRYVQARTIDVWLPESYSSKQKYAVLYMHDGQMLYDSTAVTEKIRKKAVNHPKEAKNTFIHIFAFQCTYQSVSVAN